MHSYFVLSLAAALAVHAAPTASNLEGLAIPLGGPHARHARNADGSVNMEAFLSEVSRGLVKYDAEPVSEEFSRSMLAKRATNQALTDQNDFKGEDVVYYAAGVVGASGPQTFQFNFDTGTADVVIPGPQCDSNKGCSGNTKYDLGGTNRGNITTIPTPTGGATGNNYLDSVTIAGLTATNQNVVSLTEVKGGSSYNADSVLGLGLPALAYSKSTPWFNTLIAQKKVAINEFSFYFGRYQSRTQSGSQLTLAGRDTAKYTGTLTQLAVTATNYWQVALTSVNLNGAAVSGSSGQAVFDTGLTTVFLPTSVASSLFGQISGSQSYVLNNYNPPATLYTYPCSYTGTVSLTMGGKQFAINALDFNQGIFGRTNGQDQCLAGIIGADFSSTQKLTILGTNFLKNWYSIYNYGDLNGKPSIRLAAAVGNQ